VKGSCEPHFEFWDPYIYISQLNCHLTSVEIKYRRLNEQNALNYVMIVTIKRFIMSPT